MAVKVKTDEREYSTNFGLDPLKCFNSDAELKYEEGNDENTILLNLTQQIATNEKLFDLCLISIKVLDEDNEPVSFNEVSGYSLIKITALNRSKNKTLTVEYNFPGNMTKTKTLHVPYSPFLYQQRRESLEKEENLMQSVIIPSAAGGGSLLVVIIVSVFAIVLIRKRKKKTPRENYETDENHTYGTYSRGWDGEGDHDDGDVVEVVDNNDYYGT